MKKYLILLFVSFLSFGCALQPMETKKESDPRVDELVKEQKRLSMRMDELARVVLDIRDTLVQKGQTLEKTTKQPPETKAEPSGLPPPIAVENVSPPPKAPAPKVEAPAPKVEATAPKAEVQAPKVEAPAPKVEATAPKVEATAPKAEVQAPKVEVPAPRVDENLGGSEAKMLAPPPAGEDEAALLYKKGYSAFREGNFGKAILDLEEFIGKFPRNDYADNAQFLVGEAYYSSGQFEQAIVEFNRVAERYPGEAGAPEALLRIGDCFDKLGQKERAKSFYSRLAAQYPASEAAYRAKRKLETL